MNYKEILMTGLIGLAMLAAPIAATAQDRNQDRDNSPSHSTAAPARDANRHASVPVTRQETRNDSRDQRDDRNVNRAPATASRAEHPDYRHYGDRDYDHRIYGARDYRDYNDYAYGAPYYVMPYGYPGGACAWASHIRAVYIHDMSTGHPAAASDLLPRLHTAERACGVPYGYNSYWF